MRRMKKYFLSLLSCLILCSGLARAGQEIAVVQSIRVGPYEEALEGLNSVCKAAGIHRLVISEMNRSDVIEGVRKIAPDVILAIGMEALKTAKEIKDIPIVYLMVLDGEAVQSAGGNITGVSMNISQEKQLTAILKALPETKTVGLLYDPEMTGQYAVKALDACRKLNIRLISKEIHNPRDVPLALNSMKGNVDVFWMLPDLTVVTPETVEILLLFSLENEIPVITFSEKYAELGALMSLGIDAVDIGRQAGEMAREILAGKNIKEIQHADARSAVVSVNMKIAKKLGIHVPEDVIAHARKIE
jgi:putative tryptophan/tyrosine transport system substrate-binding protein